MQKPVHGPGTRQAKVKSPSEDDPSDSDQPDDELDDEEDEDDDDGVELGRVCDVSILSRTSAEALVVHATATTTRNVQA